jgi:hypothetical protein
MEEPPLVTIGDDYPSVRQFLTEGKQSYSAADVVRMLLAG